MHPNLHEFVVLRHHKATKMFFRQVCSSVFTKEEFGAFNISPLRHITPLFRAEREIFRHLQNKVLLATEKILFYNFFY